VGHLSPRAVAQYAAEGWFYVELAPDSEGNRCLGLVHEDVPCAHSDCTFARIPLSSTLASFSRSAWRTGSVASSGTL
jgi:hypothetical protein